MALAKEIVDLHRGEISVESIEDRGTTFNISLRLGKEHFRDEDMDDSIFLSNGHSPFSSTSILESPLPETVPLSADQPVVLIAEDNGDMRDYVRRTLGESYCIQEAANGRQALEKTMELLPDLVLADVMMPELDGQSLCKKIKSTEITSHIPVILLTAKADRDSKLAGLATGADDYLYKPFDPEELRIIVRNRIEQRQTMRSHFSREITLESKRIQISSLDEKFLAKVLVLIEDHMADESFSIEAFSMEAGYSRMQLYRKVKALTGQTPSQFIRSIRLKRAAQLLQNKSDNITQIAYSVGFGSLSYFNKCFKEHFGVTPGQFAQTGKR